MRHELQNVYSRIDVLNLTEWKHKHKQTKSMWEKMQRYEYNRNIWLSYTTEQLFICWILWRFISKIVNILSLLLLHYYERLAFANREWDPVDRI